MSTFHLQIVTPDGGVFDGQAEKIIVRSTVGDICILPKHINYVTTLGMGEARITIEGVVRRSACIGGMLAVTDGAVNLVVASFEWSEDIDTGRAEISANKAQALLDNSKNLTPQDMSLAEARLKRALVRTSVAEK